MNSRPRKRSHCGRKRRIMSSQLVPLCFRRGKHRGRYYFFGLQFLKQYRVRTFRCSIGIFDAPLLQVRHLLSHFRYVGNGCDSRCFSHIWHIHRNNMGSRGSNCSAHDVAPQLLFEYLQYYCILPSLRGLLQDEYVVPIIVSQCFGTIWYINTAMNILLTHNKKCLNNWHSQWDTFYRTYSMLPILSIRSKIWNLRPYTFWHALSATLRLAWSWPGYWTRSKFLDALKIKYAWY